MSVTVESDEEFPSPNLDERMKALSKAVEGWQIEFRKARDRLYGILGDIYELAAKMGDDTAHRDALIRCVKQREDVKKSTRWSAEGRNIVYILLVGAFGLSEDMKTRRSQWQGSIDRALQENIGRTREAFIKLVKKEGGLRKLASKPANDTSESTNGSDSSEAANSNPSTPGRSSSANENFPANVLILESFQPQKPIFELEIDDGDFIDDVAVLLVKRMNAAGDKPKIEVLKTITKKPVVEKIAAEAIQELRDHQRRIYTEATLIYELNEFTLMYAKAPGFQKPVDSNAALKFRNAYNDLCKDPEWAEKYELKGSKCGTVLIQNDGHVDHSKIEVVNDDAHKWDPAQYIKGVPLGKLAPYDLTGRLEQCEAGLKKYLAERRQFLDTYQQIQAKKPRKKKLTSQQSGGATLEAWLNQGDEADEAEPDKEAGPDKTEE